MIEKTAKAISIVFHPVFWFFYTFLVLMFCSHSFYFFIFGYKIWLIVFYIIVSTIILPISLVAFITKDLWLSDKNKRSLPLLLMALIYFVIYYFFRKLLVPDYFLRFILSLSSGLILMIFINYFIKISFHTTMAGAFIALTLTMALREPGYWISILSVSFIISGLIGTCRLILSAHTQAEVYSGYLLGFITVWMIV